MVTACRSQRNCYCGVGAGAVVDDHVAAVGSAGGAAGACIEQLDAVQLPVPAWAASAIGRMR